MNTELPALNRGRRLWLLSAGSLLITAATASPAAQMATETRHVGGFDEVIFTAAGELDIVQSLREQLIIEAEPAILRKITSEVRGRQLVLGFAPGNVVAREPIRLRLEMPTLSTLELQSSGNVHLGPFEVHSLSLRLAGSGDIRMDRLKVQNLVLRLPGSGTLSITQGQADLQRIEIDGAGTVDTAGMACRSADVSIAGSGDVRLAASEHLQASISGSGSVRFLGNPQLVRSISGAGTIDRE